MVAGRGATANRLVPAAKRDESDYSSASGRSKSEEKSPRTNANVSRLLIIFTAAVLPLISATVVILTVWGIEDAIETSNNERCVSVESVAWSSSTLVDLVLQGKPIVVENTPFTTWPCMDWTWPYLQNSVHADLPVKLSRTAEFKYSTSSKPYSGSAAATNRVNYSNIVMNAKKLFHRLQNGDSSSYVYASGEAELLGIPEDFGDPRDVSFPADMHSDAQINFWFGSMGVTADWHYDTSDNLHAMIHGNKTFHLYPPSAFRQLGLYPSIHHFYRQAQVPFNISSRGKLVNGDKYSVTLQADQALYIPPYWFHSVQTHVASMSVNAWSQSEAFLTMEKIYQLPIALESDWPRCKLLYGAWLFVDEVLHKTLSDERAVFLAHTLASRYKLVKYSNADENEHCLALKQCAADARMNQLVPAEELDIFKSAVTSRVADHVMLFLSMARDVRAINLGNFVEHLYSMVLGVDHQEYMPCLLGLAWQ